MFRKLLFITVLLLGLIAQSAVAQSWNCDDFVGTWRFQGDDYSMSAQRTVILQFSADRSFYVDMYHKGSNSEGLEIQTGRWQCYGGLQTMHIETIDGVAVGYTYNYEIMELSPAYFRFRSTPENCYYAGSDCPTTYEYFRQ